MSFINGKIPIVHAFIEEEGCPVLKNDPNSLKLPKNTVWQTFHSTAARNSCGGCRMVLHHTALMMRKHSFLKSSTNVLSADERRGSGRPTALMSIRWISTSGLQLSEELTAKTTKD